MTQFEILSDNSRIWIYQASREISKSEKIEIEAAIGPFITTWAAHGQDLLASGTVKYDRFLIIATDESFNLASGCSIDSSVRFVQELGSRLSIDFFDRSQLAFLVDDNVKLITMKDMKEVVERKEINPDSLFFQNTIQTKGELEDSWLVKAGESWIKRYFKVQANV